VEKSHPNANYGTKSALRTDASPLVRSYARFSVSSLPGPVSRAALKVHASSANSAGFSVARTGTSWGEGTITWANAPAPGTVLGSSGPVSSGTWVSLDVTSMVTGTGVYGLALTTMSGNAISFNSRESGSTYAPRLVVETASATTTSTTTAPSTTTTTAPTSSTQTGCHLTLTARQARYNILGYLWSDGLWNNGHWNYLARNSCVSDRFSTALAAAGEPYTMQVTSAGYWHYDLTLKAPFDVDWGTGMPADTAAGVATKDDLSFFLAADIEGEGSTTGKVLDDPHWSRTAGIVDLLSRMNVVVKPDKPAPTCGCSSDPTYWNTYIDPAASTTVYNGYISIVRSWPYATYGRVPQYH
jgi:hypothetical protein